MPFKIQRNPRGLNELLSIFGGATPTELEDRVRATIDQVQFYGLTQAKVQAVANAAAAEGTNAAFTLSQTQWTVLFISTITTQKTATMTALRSTLAMRLNSDVNQEIGLKSEAGGPFGATETGSVSMIYIAPYPQLIPPNTLLLGRNDIIGTDATAAIVVSAYFGVVGP